MKGGGEVHVWQVVRLEIHIYPVCVFILRSPQAQNELTPWGLSFEDKLLSLKGRVLPTERIIQGSRTVRRHIDDDLRVARC